MQAVILAGGRGKRLRPITDYIPKPMIPIRNVPIMEWQVRYLKKFGVDEVIVCTGYRTDVIEDFVRAKGGFGIEVSISAERTPLGTGGAIKKLSGLIKGGGFLVMNGDVITNMDLTRMMPRPNSIAAIPMRTKYGMLDLEGDRVSAFSEKRQIPGVYMNAGVYHLSRDMLDDLPRRGNIEETVFPRYAAENRLGSVVFEDPLWYSIDSYKDMQDCERDIGRII